tara:strand:- start:206 stop:2263 length:2058 start_codon:yes stop_codon:yes gene_type:complete
MQKLQLYISSTRVDLFKDESVSITQTIQNVKDISKIFTEFTQSFTVPASKINNILFRHYYNFDITVNSFDARNKVSSEIQLNSIPFKKGYIKLEGVEMQKNKAYAYKITFFGNTVNLKDTLGEDELSSLTSINTLNSSFNDYSFSHIRYGLINGLNDVITPLITHTRQLYYDSTAANYGNGNLYYFDTTNANGVYWSDLKYAIRLDAILDSIKSTYSLTFSTDFFDSSNLTWYNLYMWLHRKKGDVEPAQQVPMTYQQLLGWNIYSSSPSTPLTSEIAGGITIPSSLVTEPATLDAFTLSFIPTTTGTDYSIRVFRNSSLVYQRLNVQDNQEIDEGDFTIQSGTYTVSAGSTSTVVFGNADIRWEFNGYLGGEVIGGWTDEWRSDRTLTTTTTFEFVITEQIPKMKIIDFLSAIFKMFNLTAYVDDAGTIVVRTLDSYYAASSIVWDINEYVDIQKGTVDIALPFKEIKFAYKGLGSFLAKQFEQLENTGWGSLDYSDLSEFNAPQKDYTIEIPFEHLQYQRLVNATGGDKTDIQWGWMVDDNKASYYKSPVIFYGISQTSATAISLKSDTANYTTNAYIIPSNSRALASATSTENINFNAEINEYTEDSTFTGTLFENNYKTYIQSVFNSRQRLTKVKAYMPLKMIYNLKLNDKISLNNYTYKINSLTTNLITGESNFELLNVL